MCMASPTPQVDHSRPANYPLHENYGRVTSSTVTPDGKVHGGWAIGDQYQSNMKAYGQATPPRPGKTGATSLKM